VLKLFISGIGKAALDGCNEYCIFFHYCLN
jgi:hypothetical protein